MSVPFVTKLDPSLKPEDRRSGRVATDTSLGLWASHGRPFNIIVHDISLFGFRAEFSSDLEVGDEVGLRAGHSDYVPARIVWVRGRDHGCEFMKAITNEEIDAIVGRGAIIPPMAEIADTEVVEGAENRSGLLHRHVRLLLLVIVAIVALETAVLAHWAF